MDEQRRQALLQKMPKTAAEVRKTAQDFMDGTHPLSEIAVKQVGPTSLISYRAEPPQTDA